MAYYAFLDKNNIVTEVIVGKDECNYDWERHYGDIRGQLCKRTSYNTGGGEHKLGGIQFRKNGAAVGYKYDDQRDAFIPPQPHLSWTLNEETCIWDPPISHPKDERLMKWSEEDLDWIEQTTINN